jgi:hypothetical protein
MVFGDDITRRIQEVQQYVGGSIFYNRANIGELWHILDACWLLVPLGFIAIYRRERSDDYKLWLAMGATAVFAIVILPLVYPFIVDRLLFMAVPLLLPFAVMGLGMISWKYAYALAAAGGLISLSTTWMIYHYNKSGLLAIGAAAYMLILGFTLLLSKEEQEKG